jgi:hypothetical protein
VELRDQDGRAIRAELLRLNGEQLTLRRSDGMQYTIDLSMLNKHDAAQVRSYFGAAAKTDSVSLNNPQPRPSVSKEPAATAGGLDIGALLKQMVNE